MILSKNNFITNAPYDKKLTCIEQSITNQQTRSKMRTPGLNI